MRDGQANVLHVRPGGRGFGMVREPSPGLVDFRMGILVCAVILLLRVNPTVARRLARKAA